MSELLTKADFVAATGLKKIRMGAAAGPLMRLTGIHKINQIWPDLENLTGMAFIEAVQHMRGVEISVSGKGLEQIPAEGPFITVSNHPLGLWDGLALLKVLGQKRSDFKVLANFILEHISPVKDSFILVNPFNEATGKNANLSGMKQAYEHLKAGKPLGFFPAGEVSSLHGRAITDAAWQKSIIKLIQKAEVPVIPIYFEGSNSPLFHLLGMIHPSLRTVAIPAENFKRKNEIISMRVGSPISVKELTDIQGTDRLGRYLRARTYSLGSSLKVSPFFRRRAPRPAKAVPLAPEISGQLLREEIRLLPESQFLSQQQEFDLILAKAEQIPHCLQEIGRLRELTFRSVGEGTLYERDLDEYDLYYEHLFLWDREAGKIGGAYRIGRGDEIMLRYGKKGFYTHSLFKMKAPFERVLGQGLELGRSFIVPEYQRKRLPLFILWKGLHEMAVNNPRYRYLFGPVSISNEYSRLSRELIVAMIRKFFWEDKLAQWVKARKRFSPRLKHVSVEDLLAGIEGNLKKMDCLIEELEPTHMRLPVLLKKYIKQKARIISFNVDPQFCNSLDGFIIMDLEELPEDTHKMLR